MALLVLSGQLDLLLDCLDYLYQQIFSLIQSSLLQNDSLILLETTQIPQALLWRLESSPLHLVEALLLRVGFLIGSRLQKLIQHPV